MDRQSRLPTLLNHEPQAPEVDETAHRHQEIINQLKEQNKALQAQLKEDLKIPAHTQAALLENSKEKLIKLKHRRDELLDKLKKAKQKVASLETPLAEVQLTTQKDAKNHPKHRQIRVLENRIHKTSLKNNELTTIGQFYKESLNQLKKETESSKSQISQADTMLERKTKYGDELMHISNVAWHAMQLSKAELQKCEKTFVKDRTTRNLAVAHEKQAVMYHVSQCQAGSLATGKPSKSQDLNQTQKTRAEAPVSASSIPQTPRVELKELAHQEALKERLIQVTGTHEVDELRRKLILQQKTHEYLTDLVHQSNGQTDFQDLIEPEEADPPNCPELVQHHCIEEFELVLQTHKEKLDLQNEEILKYTQALTGLQLSLDSLSSQLHLNEPTKHGDDPKILAQFDQIFEALCQQAKSGPAQFETTHVLAKNWERRMCRPEGPPTQTGEEGGDDLAQSRMLIKQQSLDLLHQAESTKRKLVKS